MLWEEFIKNIQDTTKLFVINGDPLDIPPPDGQTVEPDQTNHLKPLKNLALSGTKILYIIGNHDIGIAGLKIEQEPNSQNILTKATVQYPCSTIEANEKTYYLEHGDYLEPFAIDTFLALVKYFFKFMFNRNRPKDLIKLSSRISQRRVTPKKDGDYKQLPGVINKRSFFDNLLKRHPEVIYKYQRDNWRNEALIKLKTLQKEQPEKNISGIIFGHTHLPDEYTISSKNSKAVYYNSGSWATDVPCASYLVIKPDGSLKRRCFIKEKRGQDLSNETCDLKKCKKC